VIHVRRAAGGARRVEQIGLVRRASDGLVVVAPAVTLGPGGMALGPEGPALLELVGS